MISHHEESRQAAKVNSESEDELSNKATAEHLHEIQVIHEAVLSNSNIEENFQKSRKVENTQFLSVAKSLGPDDFLIFEKPYSNDESHKYNLSEPKLQKDLNAKILPFKDTCQAKYSPYTEIFNEEAAKFATLLSPIKEDHCLRQWAIDRITETLREATNGVDIQIFGSFITKLYLPASDIDLVAFVDDENLDQIGANFWLRKIGKYLENANLAKTITITNSPKVPIIRFKIPKLCYNVDIHLNLHAGRHTTQAAIDYLEEYPGTRQLYLLVKSYLRQRNMNDIHTGGLGSYSILLMVVNFLQNHQKVKSNQLDPLNDLGILFIEFLDFYGNKFESTKLAISTINGGAYSTKIGYSKKYDTSPITIWDPTNSKNNVANGSFNYLNIKNAFSNTYYEFSSYLRLSEQNNSNFEMSHSIIHIPILEEFAQLSEYIKQRRNNIKDIFYKKRLKTRYFLSTEDLMELN